MPSHHTLNHVSDDELMRRLAELVAESRRAEADLVAHIGEVEARMLYAREASPSMFAYCTERLHLSEAEAYLRITVARAARKHGVLLDMLRDGRLHLSGIVRLLPVLTQENRDALLAQATHRSKRQILELVAELSPRPDIPACMRKLPEHRPALVSLSSESRPRLESEALDCRVLPASPGLELRMAAVEEPRSVQSSDGQLCPDRVDGRPAPAVVEPLSPARYRVQFTASAELHNKLERLSALMRSDRPDIDLAAVIEEVVSEKLERLEARRFGKTNDPRKRLEDTSTEPTSRRVPAAVRRAVFAREGGRCHYVDERSRRCTERTRLEFHHRHPFGMGGDHSPRNVSLLCQAHNRLLAVSDYGAAAVGRRRNLVLPTPDLVPTRSPRPLVGRGRA